MTRRVVTSVLVCAAIVFACAPRVGGGDPADTPTPDAAPADTGGAPGGIEAALSHTIEGSTATFALAITNRGPRTELRFPSGMTHEILVLDAAGREVWRSSQGRLYTQAIQTRQLRTGNAVRYEARWTDAEPGSYRVVARLNSQSHPHTVESRLIVSQSAQR